MSMKKIPADHISKKNKNTYTISMSSLMPYSLFGMCKNTPLAIVVKNGVQVQQKDGWMKATEFPNPLACEMGGKHEMFNKILGERISCQIVEYLDKETKEPVLLLFPHGIYVYDKFEDNYMERLNHASRRDLDRLIKLRNQLFSQYAERQK